MLNISLPEQVPLHCPFCKVNFTMGRADLHRRAELYCPACGRNFALYDGLSGKLRERVYQTIRNYIERRVYDEQQLASDGYFEDLGNLK